MIPFATEELAPVQRPSFWRIADDLEAYHETLVYLDACIAEGAPEDRAIATVERAELLQDIERLSEALVKKTDDLAGVMRRMKSGISEDATEEKRIHARRKAKEAALENLKGYTQSVMVRNRWMHLKTPKNTIAIRGNGGVEPLRITEARDVPPAYKDTIMTITCDEYDRLWDAMIALRVAPSRKDVQVNNTRLREALLQPCATCGGRPWDATTDYPCESCAGTGQARVPGAYLEDRGAHIEVR